MFGEFIKSRRMSLGHSLRSFCVKNDDDVVKWSELERGVVRPPTNSDRLNSIAKILALADEEISKLQFLANTEALFICIMCKNSTIISGHVYCVDELDVVRRFRVAQNCRKQILTDSASLADCSRNK